MVQKHKTNSSVSDSQIEQKKKIEIFPKRKEIDKKKFSIGIVTGVSLTIITLVLQCIAFFTPHWKEISPNTHSLYVDGVDALIRTELLHYFNSVHRYNRHSYGLFQRCEYFLSNSSKYSIQRDELFNLDISKRQKTCTKNFLPTYRDDHFNECHSLPYYRFCAKANEKTFNINNDYLRATFDIAASGINRASTSSCDCHYPPYVKGCHAVGILALIFLFLTSLLFGLFPWIKNSHDRLKLKCFGVLSSLLSIIFLMINLIIIFKHLEYESIEYLVAIERHYKLTQIYKLSQDMTVAIDRFLLSITIRIGYSAIIAWIAFFLSIIDGIFLMATCKIKHHKHEKNEHMTLSYSPNEEHHTFETPLVFTETTNDSQPPPAPPSMPVMNNFTEPNSRNEKYPRARIVLKEDEV